MIGKTVEVHPNKYHPSIKYIGEVLDKITESSSERDDGLSIRNQDLVLTRSKQYYMISDEKGMVHRVHPKYIYRIINK